MQGVVCRASRASQGDRGFSTRIDVMIFARLIFINLHVLVCEGILGVLDDVSAGVRVSAVLALSQVFVSFLIQSTHVNKLACMHACMSTIDLFCLILLLF